MTPSPRQLRSAAEAIANARAKRRGAVGIVNVWDLLTPKLRDEVLEDAGAALEASAGEENDLDVTELVDAIVAERNARVLEAADDRQAEHARAHANRLIQEAWEKIDAHWNRF